MPVPTTHASPPASAALPRPSPDYVVWWPRTLPQDSQIPIPICSVCLPRGRRRRRRQ